MNTAEPVGLLLKGYLKWFRQVLGKVLKGVLPDDQSLASSIDGGTGLVRKLAGIPSQHGNKPILKNKQTITGK